ncbi:hypothetical protein EVAR_2555_1 [Eumeta japonica]|uniref:Uncharacterized protein n=1 Tax=Eumeta variegata TaxID=151549 RepID=A0A4C1SME0_EUMVA|nr:hypothetical protein EVAR_2555_1 [Eumeta japonica]
MQREQSPGGGRGGIYGARRRCRPGGRRVNKRHQLMIRRRHGAQSRVPARPTHACRPAPTCRPTPTYRPPYKLFQIHFAFAVVCCDVAARRLRFLLLEPAPFGYEVTAFHNMSQTFNQSLRP